MTDQTGTRRSGLQRADRCPEVLHQGDGLRRPADPAQGGWSPGGLLLSGPLEPRQGGPLDPRGQLHRLLLVEGLRQGRDHHLGGPADRLPVHGRRPAGVRAPGMPPWCGVLLVHLLADPRALPLRPRRPARDVPRGQGDVRRPGRGVGLDRPGPRAGAPLQVGPRQGRPGPRELGRGRRDRRGRPRLHGQALGPRPDRGLLADPGDVSGVVRLGLPLPRARSAHRCCPSTTGTPTCPTPHRRCSATRPTSPSPATGGTRAT